MPESKANRHTIFTCNINNIPIKTRKMDDLETDEWARIVCGYCTLHLQFIEEPAGIPPLILPALFCLSFSIERDEIGQIILPSV